MSNNCTRWPGTCTTAAVGGSTLANYTSSGTTMSHIPQMAWIEVTPAAAISSTDQRVEAVTFRL
jgi:hypothetical protein